MITQVRFDNMSEFKVGDKVVLRPKTKPYSYTNPDGKQYIRDDIDDKLTYNVLNIYDDGEVRIRDSEEIRYSFPINPHHLKHAKEDYNDNPYRFEYAVGSFDNPRSRLHDQLQGLQELDTNIEPCDNEELRFMIFHSNPSRTLQEMQDIEKWLLNK